jgi:hypothetical protein
MAKEKEERGRQSSIEGFANEKIACGILMKKYGNVSSVELPLSPYDIIIVRKKPDGTEDILRLQCKTATHSVKFTGGTRGGVDRIYRSDVKTYVQCPETSDCIVGVHFENGEPVLYFVPTCLIATLGTKSVSNNRIQALKNNYEFLENCKDLTYVLQKAREYGII